MGTGGVPKKTMKRNISNITPEILNNLKNDGDFFSSLNDQYLCPMCKKVPELTNIFTDNGCIELKCKEHGTNILTVKQYFDKLKDSEFLYFNFKCKNCHKIQKNCLKNGGGIFQYCYICRKEFCEDCCQSELVHPKFHNNSCINVNDMNTRCLDHFDEGNYTSFCLDDNENVCEEYVKKKHRGHNIKTFFNIELKEKIIIERNKVLTDLIKFNNLILNTYKKHPDNYLHIMNINNLANLIDAENSRNPKELENIFKELERNINLKNNAIKEFKDKYNFEIKGNEERLILKNKGLDDNALKLLSNIKLYNLKEIDLSFNKIKNIDYLEYLYSGFLEYLSLNDNIIEDITVLENMDFSKLKELNLQNNNIKKVKSLVDVKMPDLQLLRIENNDLDPSLKEMKQLINKYEKKLVCVVQTFQEFNKKYEVNLTKNSSKLDLVGNSKGNDILKDLYLILPEINDLTELKLADCGIDNISVLSRIYLPKVEKIDLSFNKIIHLEPLCNLRKNKLRTLYLNDNNISDIFPLKNIQFYGNTGKITLENNNIIKNYEVENILNELKSKNISIKIDE